MALNKHTIFAQGLQRTWQKQLCSHEMPWCHIQWNSKVRESLFFAACKANWLPPTTRQHLECFMRNESAMILSSKEIPIRSQAHVAQLKEERVTLSRKLIRITTGVCVRCVIAAKF
jgi:hypothetical protein